MQRTIWVLAMVAGATAVLAAGVYAAAPEDGQAAFAKREDTMRRMGHALYLGAGQCR